VGRQYVVLGEREVFYCNSSLSYSLVLFYIKSPALDAVSLDNPGSITSFNSFWICSLANFCVASSIPGVAHKAPSFSITIQASTAGFIFILVGLNRHQIGLYHQAFPLVHQSFSQNPYSYILHKRQYL